MTGEDTWIIRFNKFGSANSKSLATIWNDLAARFEGLASVGAMDMLAAYTDGEISRDYRVSVVYSFSSSLPIFCVSFNCFLLYILLSFYLLTSIHSFFLFFQLYLSIYLFFYLLISIFLSF